MIWAVPVQAPELVRLFGGERERWAQLTYRAVLAIARHARVLVVLMAVAGELAA